MLSRKAVNPDRKLKTIADSEKHTPISKKARPLPAHLLKASKGSGKSAAVFWRTEFGMQTKMAKPLFIAEHSCHARGLLGRLISKIMAFDTAAENRRAIELLEVSGAKNILDFGCGHGRWLGVLHRMAPAAKIVGIDYSLAMVREATARNRKLISQSSVQVKQSKGAVLPFDTGHFDKILSMHTVYFLHPLEDYLAEIFRVTASGGDVLLGFRPAEDEAAVRSAPSEIYRMRSTEEVRKLAVASGFAIQEMVQAAPPSKSMIWLKLKKA